MKSLIDYPWHYIVNGVGAEELYDLTNDPDELRNLAGEKDHEVTLGSLRGASERFFGAVSGRTN